MKPAYEYEVYLPQGMEPGRKYPTLFTLHGKGSNEKNMHGLTESLSSDFILIHIRGNLRMGAGFQFYELKSLGNPIREQFDQAMEQLESFVEYATAAYPVDANKRYFLGFSQGAILSMSLALRMGKGLKGVVALNGYVPDFVKSEYALQSVEDTSIFVSHGEFDSVFPVAIGHATAAYFKELTPHLTFRLYPSDHGVIPQNRDDVLEWLRQDANSRVNVEMAVESNVETAADTRNDITAETKGE
ncbi:alpha/beta hydrolase [Paenibacillus sp. CAU 1782]